MSGWLRFAWRRGYAAIPPICLLFILFQSWRPLYLIIGVVVSVAGTALASYAHYRRLADADALVSRDESLVRATSALPEFDDIDSEFPLVGIVTAGQHRGCYVAIIWYESEGVRVFQYRIKARRLLPTVVAGADGLTFEQLRERLKESSVSVLPQGPYANVVWRNEF